MRLRLLLSSQCNARCLGCHNEFQGPSRAGPTIDASWVAKLLPMLGELIELNEVVLSGGEPTLHPGVLSIAEVVKNSGIFLSMNTNALVFSRLEAVLPLLDEIKVHLESPIPARNMELMGVSPIPIMRAITKALAIVPRVVVNSPIRGVDQASLLAQATKDMGVGLKLIELLDTRGPLEVGVYARVLEALLAMGYISKGYQLSKRGHLITLLSYRYLFNEGDQSIYVEPQGTIRLGAGVALPIYDIVLHQSAKALGAVLSSLSIQEGVPC